MSQMDPRLRCDTSAEPEHALNLRHGPHEHTTGAGPYYRDTVADSAPCGKDPGPVGRIDE